MDFAARLAALLEQTGTTNYRLAKHVGCSSTTVANWLLGKEIRPGYLQRVAEFFGVTTDFLLGRTDAPNDKTPAQGEITLDELEFALFGELRELTEEDKQELLRDARRMRELRELRIEQRKRESDPRR